MTFNNSTSDADPGAGKIAFNNGTLSSVSVLFVDDADDGGADITTFVQSFDDVSNSTARGIVTITKEGTPATFATYKVSGAITDASGYTKVPVSHLTSNGSFSNTDGVGVHFSYSGADGSGDIEGVTAWTNLSGGGTTGTVTLNLADATTSAKGAASFSSDNFAVSSGVVTIKDGGVAAAELASGLNKIGQIVSTTKTDTFSQSTSGATFYNPTGFSRTITPVATSSKIFIFASCAWSAETNFEIGAKITRTIGGSEVDTLIGDASSSRTRAFLSERSNAAGDYGTMTMVLLDSPNTTSEITYKPVAATEGSATLYLNRHHDDSDATSTFRCASTIICVEVLA